MYIILNKNNFIITASWGGILEEGFEVDDFDFEDDIRAYQYVDGKIVLNQERLEQLKQDIVAYEEINELQTFIDETQVVVTQAFEDGLLGVESDKEVITEIVKKRQQAKIRIQELQEEIINE